MHTVGSAREGAGRFAHGPSHEAGRDDQPFMKLDARSPAGDDQRRPEPAAASRGGVGTDLAEEATTLIYMDPRPFTRDCIGRWLQGALRGVGVQLVDDLAEIEGGGAQPSMILVNAGSMSREALSELTARAGDRLPDVPIVLLSDQEDVASILRAFKLGVRGYIPTSLASQVALEAVRLVCAGGSFLPAAAFLPTSRNESEGEAAHAVRRAGEPAIPAFTQRQIQILGCLRRGMANKLIAYELNMRESTVKVHIRTIMRKLNATNRTQVVYLTRGLFQGAD